MIALYRRLASIDALLVTLSCTVIIVSLWPSGQPSQSFQVTGDDGRVQVHALPLDDPMLGELKRRHGHGVTQLPPAKLAVARWTCELADFYSRHCSSAADNAHGGDSDPNAAIVPVSFEESSASRGITVDPATPAYWVAVEAQLQDKIGQAERQIADRQNLPKVVFGRVVPTPKPRAVQVLALVAGLLIAGGYTFWHSKCQPRTFGLSGKNNELVRIPVVRAIPSDGSRSTPVQLEIPRRWVRVRQPARVWLRRLCLLSIVTGAAVCMVA
jgi:hypothetical protein